MVYHSILNIVSCVVQLKLVSPVYVLHLLTPRASTSQVALIVKNPPTNAGDLRNWGWEDTLEAAWQPTPVYLPGKNHGQKSLAGYSPWGQKKVDATERLAAAAAKSLQSCPTLCDPRPQPTRLRRPWDSPGKNTGVGCHFLLQCMKVKSESEVTQSCPTFATPWTAAYQAPLSMGFFQTRVRVGCHYLLR